jgi:hypothetical protein
VTCDAQIPAQVFPAKDPLAGLDYAVNFESECARRWSKRTDFTNGTRIRVYAEGSKGAAAGFDMVAQNTGRTGSKEPTFPSVIGDSVTDGSIVWTCAALSTGSLRATISGTPTWTADTGVTVSSQALDGLKATALISGGTDGVDYQVIVQAVLSNGATPVQVCSLPVRRAVKVCLDE